MYSGTLGQPTASAHETVKSCRWVCGHGADEVEVGPGVVEFVREHGGRLFVWLSESGVEHETARPKSGVEFIEVPGDGFTLCVDRSIDAPERWRLVFHRFPRPHVRALWNGTGGFSQTSGLPGRWEGAGFMRAPWTPDD